jgi:hypothetical protein
VPGARFADIHPGERNLKPRCNISYPSFTSRHTGARRRMVMEIVAVVMLSAIVLYMFQQVQDL